MQRVIVKLYERVENALRRIVALIRKEIGLTTHHCAVVEDQLNIGVL
jgi:hypothetical protein